MDFSACVISKGLGPAPVKLGYSSFSTGLQIKQSCLAKQNPLQSYFPPSVWPGKIQGNHFNPEAFPHRETLDQSDWRKGPINTLSRPFLKLSTSSVGVSEKLHLTLRLSQQESCFTGCTSPTLSEKPPWPENICSLTSVFLFLPIIWVRHISPILTTSWLPTPVQDLPRYLPDILLHTGAVFTCCQSLPESSSCSLRACCLFRRLQQGRLYSARLQLQGPQGLMEGLNLTILFQRGLKRMTKKPKPSCLDGNPTPAGLCETSQHRKAMDYGLHRHTIFSNATVVLGCQSTSTPREGSTTTKVWTFYVSDERNSITGHRKVNIQCILCIFESYITLLSFHHQNVPLHGAGAWFYLVSFSLWGDHSIFLNNRFNKALKPKTLLMVSLVHTLLFSGKCDRVSFQEILSMLYFHSSRGTTLTRNSMTGLLQCPRVCNEKSLYLPVTQSRYNEWQLVRSSQNWNYSENNHRFERDVCLPPGADKRYAFLCYITVSVRCLCALSR